MENKKAERKQLGLPNRVIVFLQYAWTYLTYQKAERIIIPEGVLPPVQQSERR